MNNRRFVLMVDAGYLIEQYLNLASNIQSNPSLQGGQFTRSDIEIVPDPVFALLKAKCAELTQLEFLRIYWYDAAKKRVPSEQQIKIYSIYGVKLRLGSLYTDRSDSDEDLHRQKAVDSMMVLDMIQLARNRAVDDIVILTGDEDMLPGVEEAQAHGIRVMLLSVQGRKVSRLLRWNIDNHLEIGFDELRPCFSLGPRLTPQAPQTPSHGITASGTVPDSGHPTQVTPELAAIRSYASLLTDVQVKQIVFFSDNNEGRLAQSEYTAFTRAIKQVLPVGRIIDFSSLKDLLIEICRQRLSER